MNITCSYLAELNLFENWHPIELPLLQFDLISREHRKEASGPVYLYYLPTVVSNRFIRDTSSLIWQFCLLNYFTCPLFANSEWEDSFCSVNVSFPPAPFFCFFLYLTSNMSQLGIKLKLV